MTERVNIVKNFKDEEGAVMIQPRNILTNPPKIGKVGKNTSFGGVIPYKEDEFNRPKEFALKELHYHQSKLQDKPFSQRAKSLKFGLFNASKNVYDLREDIKDRPKLAEIMVEVGHERAFRPSHPPKKGVHCMTTISKFPQYIENPPTEKTRKKKDEDEDEKPRWKMTTN